MTSKEFSDQFDIQYNSIATNSAPSLDLYEKSVYLTRAQLELIKNYFVPEGNKYKKGFEQSSKRRNDLKELIKTYNSIAFEDGGLKGLSANSQFFKIPQEVFLIIQEQAVSLDPNLCQNKDISLDITRRNTNPNIVLPGGGHLNGAFEKIKGRPILKVIPKTHDEYNTQIDNPFKNPDKNTVWRIDYGFSNVASSLRNIELISKYNIYMYKLRYIKYPNPIILTNLNDLYPNENLSIEGKNTETPSDLHKSMHSEILDRAVELALMDYKPEQSLAMKVQMNQRNE